MDRKAVGSRIKTAIDEEVLSQRTFAEKAGVTQSYVSEIVRGNKAPSLQVIDALASKFGYSTKWVLRGEGAPKLAERGTDEADRVYRSQAPPPEGPEDLQAAHEANKSLLLQKARQAEMAFAF